MQQKIKIKLKSFDHKLLDDATKSIVMTARKTGAEVKGPIPLPRHISKFTVNRSPHVDKKSREQFEIRTQQRLVEIYQINSETMDTLKKLKLSFGVDVEIKLQEV